MDFMSLTDETFQSLRGRLKSVAVLEHESHVVDRGYVPVVRGAD